MRLEEGERGRRGVCVGSLKCCSGWGKHAGPARAGHEQRGRGGGEGREERKKRSWL